MLSYLNGFLSAHETVPHEMASQFFYHRANVEQS